MSDRKAMWWKLATHRGTLVGADSRTRRGYRRTVEMRENKRFYVLCTGEKYRKTNGSHVSTSAFPLYRLDLESVVPIPEPEEE